MEHIYTRNWEFMEEELNTRVTMELEDMENFIKEYAATNAAVLPQHFFFGEQYAGRLNTKEYANLLRDIATDFMNYVKYEAIALAKAQGIGEDEFSGLTGTLQDWLDKGNAYLQEVWEVISPDIEEYQTLLVKYEEDEHDDILHTIVIDFIYQMYWCHEGYKVELGQ